MVNFLIRHFIPGYENISDPKVRQKYGTLSGAVGVFFNCLLFAGKFLVSLITASISIRADAFNNLSDAASSIITMIGLHKAGKQADEEHPYGHGRYEYLTGLIISAIILIMGWDLLKESFTGILHPSDIRFSWVSVGVLAASIGVKLYMYLYNKSLGKRIGSVALNSTAMDSLGDVLSTSVVLLGQLIAHFAGIRVDAICGLFVSIFILRGGWESAKDTIDLLLGARPDPELSRSILDTVYRYHDRGVLGVHDLLIHDYGPGSTLVSLHVEVPASFTLVHAHDLIDEIEQELDDRFAVQTTIHIDPVDENDRMRVALLDIARSELQKISPGASLHDFRIVYPKGGAPDVEFDVLVPYRNPCSSQEIVYDLTRRIHSRVPQAKIRITVDRG